MQFSRKYRFALVAGVLAVAVLVAFVQHRNSPPVLVIRAIRADAPTLTTADVRRLVTKEFRIVRTVEQVPPAVQQEFSVLAEEPFRMVNPGQEMSTDMILPGVPNKRLIFAGLAEDTAVLVYEQGGYENTIQAAVFSFSDGGGRWGAMLTDYRLGGIEILRRAVNQGGFTIWESMRPQRPR